MGKKKISIHDILDIEPARSIILLLLEYEDKKYMGKTGLLQMHFRYALDEDYRKVTKIKEDPQKMRNIIRLREFFGNRLNLPVDNYGRINRNCLNSRQHLNYWLDTLKDIGAIKTKGNNRKFRYYIHDNLDGALSKFDNKRIIDSYTEDMIINWKGFRRPGTNLILYGISKKIFEKEKKQLDILLGTIDDNLKEIEKIYLKKILYKRKNIIKYYLKKINNNKIKIILREQPGKLIDILNSKITKDLTVKILVKFQKKFKNADEKYWCVSAREIKKHPPAIQAGKILYDFYWKTQKIIYKDRSLFTAGALHNHLIHLFEKGNFTKEELNYFTKIWSKTYFSKNYNLNFINIKEIIRFLNNNIEFFHPNSEKITFTRYSINTPY